MLLSYLSCATGFDSNGKTTVPVYTFKIKKVDVTEKEEQREKSPEERKGSGKGGRKRTY